MITGIHHINFIVRDLEDGIGRFERVLGKPPQSRDRLAGRGVLTARFRVGDSWLVLVQPVDDNSVPGRFLKEQGEGFFLLSFQVDDLGAEETRIANLGIGLTGDARAGLDGWRVRDLAPEDTLGAQLQLTEAGEP